MPNSDSNEDSHAGAQHFCNLVRTRLRPEERRNAFVAGCGLGHEALYIRKNLDIPVTGVDIAQNWKSNYSDAVDDFLLLEESLLELSFPDNTFDIIFYHHVIEHVSDPAKSLDELLRVLAPGGLIYVGTPNRHRALGYVGSFDASTSEKVKWNIRDYKDRLKGQFRNECGAHAGFTQEELGRLLNQRFTSVENLTSDYLHFKYRNRLPRTVLDVLCAKPLIEVTAPSVYALARKAAH